MTFLIELVDTENIYMCTWETVYLLNYYSNLMDMNMWIYRGDVLYRSIDPVSRNAH